mgnify:CR=1 FL=1
MELIKTTAQVKISKLKNRYRVVQGGTSASKTFSIIPMLIHYAVSKPNSEISIVAETFPHLRRGAFKDFQKIMKMIGYWKPECMNKSEYKYSCSNGSYREFFSADKAERQLGARRDVLFVNEAKSIKWETFHQLSVRTKRFIYIDYNPTEQFWAHTEIIDTDEADFLILTYKDNEAVDDSIVKEIEKAKEKAKTSEYWANWWRVFGLGETGVVEGLIFRDWKQVDRIPNEAKLLGYGMDFGFNDSTALIAAYLYNNQYYFDEVFYLNEVTPLDMHQVMQQKNVSRSHYIYSDESSPMIIKDLKRKGWKSIPAAKGKDSIVFGINKLQEQTFHITKNSTNIVKELRNYVWDTDRSGQRLDKPIDNFNHSIDAMRYFMTSQTTKKQGKYHYAKL